MGKTNPRKVLRSPANSGDAWTATYEVGSGGAADSTCVLMWLSPPAPGSGRVYGSHARKNEQGREYVPAARGQGCAQRRGGCAQRHLASRSPGTRRTRLTAEADPLTAYRD